MKNPSAQHEQFFLARASDAVERRPAVWTEAEHDTIEGEGWHSADEIRRFDIEVFPLALADLLLTVLPWDGEIRHLGTEAA
jgi:hypothetical protein